ncbi:hypothetical protein LTR41_005937 [Exophiala xenobiotica]|nr:hypothetical protein LTR41_005937 [Exophiala xenobiotica]
MSLKYTLSSSALFALSANAFTPPSNQSYGSLYTPDLTHPVTQGQTFQVTWDASKGSPGQTVSLVLCNGPGTNCVLQSSAIAENITASSESYDWNVPCNLPTGTASTSTGYGMLIIVDGTIQFQYSTQFSVLENPACS